MRFSSPFTRERRTRIGRLGALAIGVAVGGLLAGAIAVASPDNPDTTDVRFTALTPEKVLASNAYIGPNATVSYLAIGGTSTVPSNATSLRLEVTATGNTTGSLKVYPMGDTTRTRSFPYSVDGPATGTAFMSVGMNDKVSFTNQATKAGKLTVKITGYSTQVTADAINGSGGVSGQVLTNTGGGNVEWRNSTGGGTGTTVQEYSVHVDGPVTAFSFSPKVAQVTAPAGVYAISVRGTVTSGGDPSCIVRNGGNASDPELFDLGVGLGNLVGKKTEVAVISGPAISLTCHSQNFAVLTDVTIVATRLGNSAY